MTKYKVEIDISKMTDEELVKHTYAIRTISKEEIKEVQTKHNLEGGVTNSYGKGKEYLNADLKSYYSEFSGIIKKYVLPIEKELKKRVKGDEEIFLELSGKTHKGFDLERLEYFENNIDNAFIGSISPRVLNPIWYSHLKKIKRLYNQAD